MPTSTRTLAMRALKTALDGIAGVALCERARRRPVKVDTQLPALLLYRGGESARDETTITEEFVLEAHVAITVAPAATDEATEEAFDAMLAEVLAAVLSDGSLGGTVQRVDYGGCERPEDPQERGVSRALEAEVTFLLQMATAEGDPYTAA